jgi:Tfp pilus assembly protein PilV
MGRRSGLTLIEVLATVFILGMGLIMVAAAFPVSIDQMRRTKEDTQAAELARSAFNVIRAQGFARSATPAAAGAGFSGTGFTMAGMMTAAGGGNGIALCDPTATGAALWTVDLLSNPNALAYGPGGLYQTSNLISASGTTLTFATGTLVCIPVLTRMVSPTAMANANGITRVEGAGVPLYRVTLVVVKKTSQVDVNNMTASPTLPLFSRITSSPGSLGPNSIGAGTSQVSFNVNVDDGVLVSYGAPPVPNVSGMYDYRTGAVYRIVDRGFGNNGGVNMLVLDDNPGLPSGINTDCIVFFNFVAAYYAYIGG